MAIFDVPLSDLRRRRSIKWSRWEPDVLPMFVAEMDAHLAPPIREALERALADGDTGYPELPDYQEAFADYAAWQWGWRVGVSDQKLATDVVTGMKEAVLACSEPGDAVVINSPIYPPFRSVVKHTGRTVVDVPLVDDRLDLEGLEAAFSVRRPKIFLLCSPHNPNGTIHTQTELMRVAELADRYGVVVVSDEIHAPLAGAAHTPYLAVPGASNALVVTSASKCWNLAAMKAGLIIGSRALLEKLNPMTSDGASYLGVIAHSTALSEARDWVAEAAREIEANKRLFADRIAELIPELSYTPSPGTYLAWLDCAPLGLDDPGRHFHRVARVRFNLGREFAPDATQFVRVNLAASRAVISEAVERMSASLEGVRARASETQELSEARYSEVARAANTWYAEPQRVVDAGPATAPMPVVGDEIPAPDPMEDTSPWGALWGSATVHMAPPPLAGVHSNGGSFVNLVTSIVVGRAPRASGAYERAEVLKVPSPHMDISRNHLAIEAMGNAVVVRDLGSVNGTLVIPPTGEPFTLRDGGTAEVAIGTILDVGEEVSLRIEPPRL